MDYTKEFKEREELLNQLAEHGLAIPDRDLALDFLTRVGYFRSGAYRYVLRQLLPPDEINGRLRQYRSDKYLPEASLTHVMKLEAFDSKLARVCLEGLLDGYVNPTGTHLGNLSGTRSLVTTSDTGVCA